MQSQQTHLRREVVSPSSEMPSLGRILGTAKLYASRSWMVISGVTNGVLDLPFEGGGGDGLHKAAKLVYYVQLAVAYNRGNLRAFDGLQNLCLATMNVVDGLRTLTESRVYFLASQIIPPRERGERLQVVESQVLKDFANRYIFSILANTGLVLVNVASSVEMLSSINLINTGKLAASIGSFEVWGKPVLGFVAKIELEAFIRFSLLGSLVFLGMDALQKIYRGDEPLKAGLNFTWGASEALLQGYILMYTSAVGPALIMCGVFTASMGCLCHLYNSRSVQILFAQMAEWGREEMDFVVSPTARV